ncbi:pseudouridine synthase [Rhodoblastus sp.]|uniref:pseudouridine synthase n=1 Tax=Rhodoblastus sp. TaxID=1962975 RepID=UPI0035B0D030
MSKDTPDKTRPTRKPAAKRPAAKKTAPADRAYEGERIAKVMARAGLCSRRDAELWIEQGRVAVNGVVLTSAAKNVSDQDKVTVDGRPLNARERTRLFLFHKPRGLVTTDRDPEGRPTVFDYIAEKNPSLPRLMSVGRLDINTEGLLLLTNDGGLARVLELPSTGWLRRYRARANGETDQARLDTLAKGVTIDGVDYAGVEAKLDRVQGANVWITLGLREGKNREVKRLLEHLGLATNRLIRLSYGPFQLGETPEGAVEEVRTRVLADQLGTALAEEAGVDFEAPVIDRTPAPEYERERRPMREGGPRAKRPPAEQAEKKVRPEKKMGTEKPGPRKHVTALRSERDKAEKGPRRRTESSATEDRRGRKVVVERVSTAGPRVEPDDTRNARRFRAEREKTEAPARTEPARRGPPRKAGPRSERVVGETGAAKHFRRDGASRDEKAGGRDFARPRDEKSGGRDFSRPRGEKPSRGFGDRPAGDRPQGRKPTGGKPFGGKPSGGKPSGGPSGPRKPRGK